MANSMNERGGQRLSNFFFLSLFSLLSLSLMHSLNRRLLFPSLQSKFVPFETEGKGRERKVKKKSCCTFLGALLQGVMPISTSMQWSDR